MNFRSKLLILLLTIALLPLGLSFLAQRSLVVHFGEQLAEDTHTLLNNNAVHLLHLLVDDYGRILSRDHAMARFALQAQAQAVQQALVNPSSHLAPLYLATDFDNPSRQPADLAPSPHHLRRTSSGDLKPMPVSWNHQVFFLTQETDPDSVQSQLQALGEMTRIYRSLQQIEPELFLWQYTALESGVHSSYPGKGGYPADYDPRQRQWYQKAVAANGTVQQVLTDVTTGSLILTLAQPVYSPAGELYGVTALDIDYRQLFSDWNIPPEWSEGTHSMIMRLDVTSTDPSSQLEILLTNRQNAVSRHWSLPLEPEYIDLGDPQLAPMVQDLLHGHSAVRKIIYQGEETLLAYGARNGDAPFPMVMVPYPLIISPATQAQQAINQQIALSLSFSALLTVAVILVTSLVALRLARKVTDPILQLAGAAEQLTRGNFDARVNITSKDELEHLGNTFNGLGCRLKEREEMKQSLALAKEIQQQLLPRENPQCVNFELIGSSIYCDETGGDYYDFIPLQSEGRTLYGLAVGDVSGHGIGAALVMATARGMLHAQAEQHTSSLPQLFAEINRHLTRSIADSGFMTLFYGVLDPEHRTLDWVSAGQAPLFLYRADGQIEELSSSGIPLGILNETSYDIERRIHFAPGDMLLIGTDGLWETHNQKEQMFGTERLGHMLTDHASASAATISSEIYSALNQFRGERPFEDDLTLMLVKAQDQIGDAPTG